MDEFDKTKKAMALLTRISTGSYYFIVSDNEQTVDRLISDYSEQVSQELKDFNVVVFDYAKDIQREERYNYDYGYARQAMEYYIADNGLESKNLLGTVVAVYRHLENFALEGDTAEEKMQRLAQYLGFQNMFREANQVYRGAYYVFPTWLYGLIMQNCPDFQSQRSHTFFLFFHFSKDSTPIDCFPDWFDSERFDEILWPSYHKK